MICSLKQMVFVALIAGGLFFVADRAEAQIIWGGGVQNNFRPGTNIYHDAEPFSHRYNYSTGSFLYPFAGGARELHYLDYADRVERAYKFGYRVPQAPYVPAPSDCNCQPSISIGGSYYRVR